MPVRSLSVLIKPASSLCNCKCRYCFYRDEAENRRVESYGIMDVRTAETIIKRAADESPQELSFAFQGGEPTLAGIDFFRDFCALAAKYNKNKTKINYSIQTNGLYGDNDAWAELFYKNRFLVGLSFDGTRELHDLNRVDGGGGTAAKVLKCAASFDRHKVDYNILTVINTATVNHAAKIYSFYKKRGWRYMQFIPCLAPLERGGGDESKNEKENVKYYSPSPDKWLSFNNTLFDLWYEDNLSPLSEGRGISMSVRHLDDYLRVASGMRTGSCGTTGFCSIQNVIEADGGVYPCDFFAVDRYYLGNIKEKGFKELFEGETAQNFIRSSCVHSEKCRTCRWYPVCRGGCVRMKKNNHYIYCDAAKAFYEYTYKRITELSKLILRG